MSRAVERVSENKIVLNFTFPFEILRRVAPQDDRKGGHLLASRLPPRGKVSAKPTEEGRRAVLNFTFYILHFTFADEILRLASLAQDDRGALLLRITGGAEPRASRWQGRPFRQ